MLAAALLFSTGGAAIKLATLSSWQIAGGRSALAALTLWLLVPAWRPGRDWRPYAAGVAYGSTLVLYVVANTLTTAAHAIFLQTSAPFWILVLGPRLLGEPTRRGDRLRLGLLGAGLALMLLGHQQSLATAPDPARGNLLATLSGLSWALTLMGLRWLGPRATSSESDLAGASVVAGNALVFVVCLPLALPVAGATALDGAVVVWLGGFQIALAYLILVRGARSLRALELSLLLVLEPVLNAALAWQVHGEVPAPVAFAGAGLIAAGVIWQALGRVAADGS
ncbi:MAG: EamA family transporter [Myxococcota bacterium]